MPIDYEQYNFDWNEKKEDYTQVNNTKREVYQDYGLSGKAHRLYKRPKFARVKKEPCPRYVKNDELGAVDNIMVRTHNGS